MKACQGRIGRVFVIRLEDGDVLPGCIERFALDNGISVGQVWLIGGISGGKVVVGPRDSYSRPPQPVFLPLDNAHEVVGLGIIAPNKDNQPILHIHAALGRAGNTITGCLRPGVTTWLVGEVILHEILGVTATRIMDESSGFELLTVGND